MKDIHQYSAFNVNKEQGLGKDYLSTQWLQLVQQKFCFDWFPWQASVCQWSRKKKITDHPHTPSLSHCSKDTVHIRSWTPESRANLPNSPAESSLKLMCSNGTPVANKGEKSRELQLTHERRIQRAEEDTGEKCKKSHSALWAPDKGTIDAWESR